MIQVNDRLQAIHCPHCQTTEEIPGRVRHIPDERLEFIEMMQLHHSECASFRDVQKARANLKFRKESKRRLLLQNKRTCAIHAI